MGVNGGRNETDAREHEHGEEKLVVDRARRERGVFRGGSGGVAVTGTPVCHARRAGVVE